MQGAYPLQGALWFFSPLCRKSIWGGEQEEDGDLQASGLLLTRKGLALRFHCLAFLTLPTHSGAQPEPCLPTMHTATATQGAHRWLGGYA